MMDDKTEARATYARVSEIIGKQTADEMRVIPLDNLIRASVRGSAVDRYCTCFMNGIWIPEIESEYIDYVEEFKKWYNDNVEKVLYTKTRLYDDQLQFTGEFDMIVQLKGSGLIALIDLKTSSAVSKSWTIQLAAYKHLCRINGISIEGIYNLHIKKTSSKMKTSFIAHNDLNPHWDIFTSALKCYKYFNLKEALSC
jgi:hypothetical protein